jgi:predicted DNA-binding WGR domain protein
MGLLGSKVAHDPAAPFVRLENATEKTFWTCHVVGVNVTVTTGKIGEAESKDFMTFSSSEEALEKKNSYLERRLKEGFKIAGDQTEPVLPEPEAEATDELPAEPVLREPTPRKRLAAGTPGSKRAKGASPKASAKGTPKKATTPKKAPTPKIQKTATPKKGTTPKKVTTPKKAATPLIQKTYELRSGTPKISANLKL